MQLRCIVIEDEPLALKKLITFIEKIDYLKISETFDNGIKAISYLKNNPVDLIFLDIQMEEFTGIQFLEALKIRPIVIITSAYDSYALKGYELNVSDYLLKPFTFERFVQAAEKTFHHFSETNSISADGFIFVKTEYRLEKVRISEILYIEGMSEYLRIVTDKKKLLTLRTFRSMEEVLPSNAFIRVHKSFMVAVDKIDSIERNRIKINNTLIPISETYKDAFLARIG